MKPGVMVAPPASICRVCALARLRISADDPTAMNRPSLTANASARGRAGSMVMTRALLTMRSAATPGPAPGTGCALTSVSRPPDAKPVAPARAAPKPMNCLRLIFFGMAQMIIRISDPGSIRHQTPLAEDVNRGPNQLGRRRRRVFQRVVQPERLPLESSQLVKGQHLDAFHVA